jgi:hypothetical protein
VLVFHQDSPLLMDLARSRIALQSRCGHLAESFLRAFLVYLASLRLVKCQFLRREYWEKLFRVASLRESDVDSLLVWRADLPMLCRLAWRLWQVPFCVRAVQLRRVRWLCLAKRFRLGWLLRRLLSLRLLSRPLLWWRRLS